jgi:hypothetical protein
VFLSCFVDAVDLIPSFLQQYRSHQYSNIYKIYSFLFRVLIQHSNPLLFELFDQLVMNGQHHLSDNANSPSPSHHIYSSEDHEYDILQSSNSTPSTHHHHCASRLMRSTIEHVALLTTNIDISILSNLFARIRVHRLQMEEKHFMILCEKLMEAKNQLVNINTTKTKPICIVAHFISFHFIGFFFFLFYFCFVSVLMYLIIVVPIRSVVVFHIFVF